MASILWVGLGGFLGSILRYSVGLLFYSMNAYAPVTIVNLMGSLIMGGLLALSQNLPQQWFVFLIPGLLGGFTTFSAFSGDALQLWMKGEWASLASYTSINVLGGLALCYLGFVLSRQLFMS